MLYYSTFRHMENYISHNIRHLCAEKKLTQKEFGALFEVQQSTIGAYVSGRNEPSVTLLQKISKHFDITIDDFININLEEKRYLNKAVKAGKVAEPVPEPYGNPSKIIAAQEKTIATLEKHIVVLEKQVGYLERDVEKLQHKAS